MSENGPREGTRDLPRRSPDAGHRAVDPHSPSGVAYDRLARRERRRREEIRQLVLTGLSFETIVARYAQEHPLERDVTREEVRAIERK
ncbi:MAG: hypothetical protein ACLPZM_00860 [Thermoplasmata archaeon]